MTDIGAPPVLFRCDGNVETGLGHLSRSVALAEAFQELGQASIFAGNYSPAARMLLTTAGMPFESFPALTEDDNAADSLVALASTGADMAIVDNYRISEGHLTALVQRGLFVVLIDDFARLTKYPCSLLLNFTVNAQLLPYPRTSPPRLLGPRYMLARRRLRRLRSEGPRKVGAARRLLVAIGGTDHHGLALRVVRSLAEMAPNLILRVASGSDYVKEIDRELERFASGSGTFPIQPDLAEEFSLTDVCISGGGLTKDECAYLGLPVAVLSQTHDQAVETIDFAGHGLACDLGYGPEKSMQELTHSITDFIEDHERRAALAAAGRAMFPDDPTFDTAEILIAMSRQERLSPFWSQVSSD